MRNNIFMLPLLALVCMHSAAAMATTHNFDGNVYVNGGPLAGADVVAWIGGEKRGESLTRNLGQGYESYYFIDVQGDTSDVGLMVTFTIDGAEADESHEFEMFGNEDDFNLRVSGEKSISTIVTTSILAEEETSTTSIPATTTSAISTTVEHVTTTSSLLTIATTAPLTTIADVTATLEEENGSDENDVPLTLIAPLVLVAILLILYVYTKK